MRRTWLRYAPQTVEQLGKHIALIGLALVAFGLLIWLLGKGGFKGLPGDIRYESDGVRLYFPIVTSIIVSIVLSALVWLWSWFRNK